MTIPVSLASSLLVMAGSPPPAQPPMMSLFDAPAETPNTTQNLIYLCDEPGTLRVAQYPGQCVNIDPGTSIPFEIVSLLESVDYKRKSIQYP